MISILKEFFYFLIKHRKYVLIPLLFLLIFIGALFIIVQGTAVAPFIYTIF